MKQFVKVSASIIFIIGFIALVTSPVLLLVQAIGLQYKYGDEMLLVSVFDYVFSILSIISLLSYFILRYYKKKNNA